MENSRLLKPIRIGPCQLSHRMGMCPLTRYRASDDHTPTKDMVTYYDQRSSVPGTLIITEGTFISPEDGGYANAPGIYTQAHIDVWKKVTAAVHANGSYIFCQLWALGRTADATVTRREGITISGPSRIPVDTDRVVPERLSLEQIGQRVDNYVEAARNARAAGFDGVELHGANGYLIDQFIQDVVNDRTDDYGGSIENRSRFAVEVAKAVAEAIGADRVGMRLSPWSVFNNMRMKDPIPQFTNVIKSLSTLGIAYIHLVESRIAGAADTEGSDKLDFAYEHWDRPILIAGGYNVDAAAKLLDSDHPSKDVVAMFGRYFISTPDLPFRAQRGLPLTPYDRSTFYTPMAAEGYVDYAFSKEFVSWKASLQS